VPTISHILQKNLVLEMVVAKSHKDIGVPINQQKVVHTSHVQPNGLVGLGITMVKSHSMSTQIGPKAPRVCLGKKLRQQVDDYI